MHLRDFVGPLVAHPCLSLTIVTHRRRLSFSLVLMCSGLFVILLVARPSRLCLTHWRLFIILLVACPSHLFLMRSRVFVSPLVVHPHLCLTIVTQLH